MRGALCGGDEKANQRSPSQRREQAAESHGSPRKSCVLCGAVMGSARALIGVVGGGRRRAP